MLKHLTIENYALIEKLEISFTEGLSIITGETGAGKSIILGALSLILGQRADTNVLFDKNRKCMVEGTFSIKEYELQDFFADNELDYEDTALIRREINQQGKSRAFINDTPVNLNQLKELTEKLVDIHSQHKTFELNSNEFQLMIVDNFADNSDKIKDYKKHFTEYHEMLNKLAGLTEKERSAKADYDYFQFQFDELDKAALVAGEQVETENELKTLNNAENIKSGLARAIFALSGSDSNLISGISEITGILNQLSKYSNDIEELSKRILAAGIEFKDIASEAENLAEKIVYDPQRIEELEQRLDMIYRLQQKHRVSTVEELIAIKEDISEKIGSINSIDAQINALKKEAEDAYSKLLDKALKISAKRSSVKEQIEKRITGLLKQLGMPDSVFVIEQERLEVPGLNGTDKIKFLFTANKGSEPAEISRIASGGELSRLMLSIKSVISQRRLLPTIVFDEIDTGVSGDIAVKVGNILQQMAATMQVITITHLPQIAGKAGAHYFVYKKIKENITKTYIRQLSENERITEIANMLSGNKESEAALSTARELLGK
jgi:DNA repair protein RecN (Recombination protein N)